MYYSFPDKYFYPVVKKDDFDFFKDMFRVSTLDINEDVVEVIEEVTVVEEKESETIKCETRVSEEEKNEALDTSNEEEDQEVREEIDIKEEIE